MADPMEELQRLAANCSRTSASRIEPISIQRWQKLFGFPYSEARDLIRQYRCDVARNCVSDDHWQLVRKEREDQGHDRESYEFSIFRNVSNRLDGASQRQRRTTIDKAMYVVKLEWPIDSAQRLRQVGQLVQEPPVFSGTGETGTANFCRIDSQALWRLLDSLNKVNPTFKPTIARLSRSVKDLCSTSMAPMLGYDATLPHHRAPTSDCRPSPAQQQYPVWYFFYGNLARPEELQQRLGLTETPGYMPARVYGAKIRSWRGQYRALIDADTECFEDGSAYLVTCKEDEDTLCFYETEKYEVVRCNIHMEGWIQPGLAFRFAGGADELV